jgi:Zn-dependent protease with chaperone function
MLIQPLIIRPLFHEAYPIKDPVLRQEIVNLSQQFQLTIDDVLIIDASRYSKQSNAYIYGMFSTIQIVLYDNLVNQFPRSELLAVLSHEMAHQKLHHLHWMVLAACSFFFVGLYLVEKIFIYDRNNQVPLRIPAAHRGDVSRFLLAFFLIWQITNPLALYFSRLGEAETDRYAVEQTGLQQPLIDSLVRLYEGNLSEPNPHALIKFLFYSHPPLEERVQLIKDVKIQTKKDI